jgi:glycosyltransferase involved in cell wall biosynthesis
VSVLVDLTPASGGHGLRGIGRYVRGLATAVERLPDDLRTRLSVVTRDGGISPDRVAGIIRAESPRAGTRVPSWALGAFEISAWIRQAEPTVFHATDPHRPLFVGARTRIATAYDLIPLHEPDVLASLRIDDRWAYRRYLKQLRTADAVVAISSTTARDVCESLGVQADRVHVVYPVVERPAAVLRRPDPEPTILFVSALDPHKRPELAIRSFALWRAKSGTGRLRFLGPAEPGRVRALRLEAARCHVEDAVDIEGRVSDAVLERAYSGAAALLVTSRVEGFGLPAVEALIRGVPAIVTDTPVARETVGDDAVLVDDDAEAIAAAIDRVVAAPPSVQPERIADRFAIANAAASLAACYSSALG